MLHGRTVRSTIARGRILEVELDPAFDWTGVTICDHRDVPGENVVAIIESDQPLLASTFVNHCDEPILLLAHEDPERAEAATRAVRITYEPMDRRAHDRGRARRSRRACAATTTSSSRIRIERGDLADAFARVRPGDRGRVPHRPPGAALHREQRHDGRAHARRRHPRARFAAVPVLRAQRAAARLGLPPDKVRVSQTVTGGGFGGKEEYPSMIGGHAALLAWKSGRPVKIVYDRSEDIAATTKRHPSVVRLRTGVMRDGTLVALDVDVLMDGGAYLTLTPVVLSRGAIHAGGPYRWHASRIVARAVATNTPPNGAFRGFGAPQTLFAIEAHVNRIAAALGIDPVELRRRNAVRPGRRHAHRTGAARERRRARRAGAHREARGLEGEARRASRATTQRPRRASARAGRRRTAAGCAAASASRSCYHGSGFTGSGEVKLDSLAAMDLLA